MKLAIAILLFLFPFLAFSQIESNDTVCKSQQTFARYVVNYAYINKIDISQRARDIGTFLAMYYCPVEKQALLSICNFLSKNQTLGFLYDFNPQDIDINSDEFHLNKKRFSFKWKYYNSVSSDYKGIADVEFTVFEQKAGNFVTIEIKMDDNISIYKCFVEGTVDWEYLWNMQNKDKWVY